MKKDYDIIVFGGGIAGLFIANRLLRAGYNLILFEKDKLGGTQTLGSQGMIHGGQKYALSGHVTPEAQAISAMPERWEACFGGWGDVDLTGVTVLSDNQAMFPAGNKSFLGSFFSNLAVFAAAKAVRGKTRKLKRSEFPDALKTGPVYEMQEKVLDVKSLVEALAKNLKGRIFKGEAVEILPDGQVATPNGIFQAQMIICAAGTGNERFFELLKVKERQTQRRPLRQIMVRPMPNALFGHGITGAAKPRMTITSHPDGKGSYIWYLGGNVAEESAGLNEGEALRFAMKEMQAVFPDVNWEEKEWAGFLVDRAEPLDPEGKLPPAPVVQQRGQILIAWPSKLTFVPQLTDNIFQWLKQGEVKPLHHTPPPDLPTAEIGLYPWEAATWRRL